MPPVQGGILLSLGLPHLLMEPGLTGFLSPIGTLQKLPATLVQQMSLALTRGV